MLGQKEIGRQRMEVALAHKHYARRKWRHHGSNDLRPRLLKWFRQDADAEVERGRVRKADLETIVGEIDIVGRIALPYRQYDVDCLGEDRVAVQVEDADRFRIRRERAGADAHHETPL